MKLIVLIVFCFSFNGHVLADQFQEHLFGGFNYKGKKLTWTGKIGPGAPPLWQQFNQDTARILSNVESAKLYWDEVKKAGSIQEAFSLGKETYDRIKAHYKLQPEADRVSDHLNERDRAIKFGGQELTDFCLDNMVWEQNRPPCQKIIKDYWAEKDSQKGWTPKVHLLLSTKAV